MDGLVDLVESHFPGFDKLDYQKILLECIKNREALCTKSKGKVIEILLFSIENSTLAFLAVHPEFRKRGIAVDMIITMVGVFPKGQNIWVTTFRDGDKQGIVARALYLRCGFAPNKLVIEVDYPCQKFVLRRE